MLLSLRDDEVFELGGTAVALWDVLAAPRTIEEAASSLAGQFGADVDAVRPDVAAAVDDLVRRGVVDPVPAP